LKHFRAVLFDAAGTLIELREPVGETYARVARQHGVDLSSNQLAAAFRVAFRAAPAMVFPNAPLEEVPELERAWWREIVSNTVRAADPAARFADFDRFFANLFDEMSLPHCWREAPGARNLLLKLRSLRWATAIVSNFDRRLPAILRALALVDLFDAVVLCSDAGVAKPESGIFHHALAQLGVPASRAVFVGDDDVLDMEGARAAGLRAIDVKRLAKLDALVDQLTALPDYPGNLRGGSQHGE